MTEGVKRGREERKRAGLARRESCGLLKCESWVAVICAFEFFIRLHPCLLCPWSRGCSLEDEEEAGYHSVK